MSGVGGEKRPCQAHNGQGKPCRLQAMRGTWVCHKHGGSAPQVRRAAQLRLLAAVDPVAAELIRLALKGKTESVRLQAARDILDRAGLGATQKVEAEVTHHDGDSELDRQISSLLEAMGPVGEGPPAVEAPGTT